MGENRLKQTAMNDGGLVILGARGRAPRQDFLKITLLLFSYSCLHFPPTSPRHPSQTHLPPLLPPRPWFCLCVLYSSSGKMIF